MGTTSRQQGLDTIAWYTLVFFSIVFFMREAAQLERLMATMTAVAMPLSLYGIAQAHRVDPIDTKMFYDSAYRPLSTMGNPIASAAVLSLTMPVSLFLFLRSTERWETHFTAITLSRFLTISGALANLAVLLWAWYTDFWIGSAVTASTIALWSAGARLKRIPQQVAIPIATLLSAMAIQIVAISYSQSRGGILSLTTGVFMFLLIRAGIQRRRTIVWILLISTSLCIAFVFLLNIPNSPLAFLQPLPGIVRLSNLLNYSGTYRLDTWTASQTALISDPLRALIGYGPECFAEAVSSFLPGTLTDGSMLVDRSHNDLLDLALMTGVVGLILFWGWVTAIILCGLNWVGLANTSGQRLLFLSCWIGASVLASVGAWQIKPSLIWVAAVAGAMAGLGAYLGLRNLSKVDVQSTLSDDAKGVMAMAMAGMLTHLVEVSFCFPVCATRTIFFMYAAVIVALGLRRIEAIVPREMVHNINPENAKNRRKQVHSADDSQLRADVRATDRGLNLMIAFGVSLFVSSLVGPHTYVGTAFGQRLVGVAVPLLLWLGIYVALPPHATVPSVGKLSFTKDFLTFLAMASGFSLFLSLLRSQSAPEPFFAETIIAGLFVLMMLVVILFALFLNRHDRAPWRPSLIWISYVCIFAATGVAAWILNGRPVLADIYSERSSRLFATESGSDRTIALAHASCELDAFAPHYKCHLAACLVSRAYEMAPGPDRDRLTDEADGAMKAAYDLNPRNIKTNNRLVHYYRIRYQMKGNMKQRAAYILESLKYAEAGLMLLPNDVLPRRLFAEVLSVAADIHYELGEMGQSEPLYLRMLEHGINPARAHLALGTIYLQQVKYSEAERHLEIAYTQAPADWRASYNLASYHLTMKNHMEALRYAKIALQLAPEPQRVSLQKVIDSIGLQNVTLIKP